MSGSSCVREKEDLPDANFTKRTEPTKRFSEFKIARSIRKTDTGWTFFISFRFVWYVPPSERNWEGSTADQK